MKYRRHKDHRILPPLHEDSVRRILRRNAQGDRAEDISRQKFKGSDNVYRIYPAIVIHEIIGQNARSNDVSRKNNNRAKMSAYVQNLPLDKREQIARCNGNAKSVRSALGLGPAELEREGKKPGKKARAASNGRDAWRGSIKFDSATEAQTYDALRERSVAVIAHGKIALSGDRPGVALQDGAHTEPDFVQVLEVFSDGTFRGRLIDAKARWGQSADLHEERDFRLRRKMLRELTGMVVSLADSNGALQQENVYDDWPGTKAYNPDDVRRRTGGE